MDSEFNAAPIKETVYGASNFPEGVSVKPFRFQESNYRKQTRVRLTPPTRSINTFETPQRNNPYRRNAASHKYNTAAQPRVECVNNRSNHSSQVHNGNASNISHYHDARQQSANVQSGYAIAPEHNVNQVNTQWPTSTHGTAQEPSVDHVTDQLPTIGHLTAHQTSATHVTTQQPTYMATYNSYGNHANNPTNVYMNTNQTYQYHPYNNVNTNQYYQHQQQSRDVRNAYPTSSTGIYMAGQRSCRQPHLTSDLTYQTIV